MFLLGFIDEHKVVYHEDTDCIECKGHIIESTKLVEAWKSSLDRVMLMKGIIFRKLDSINISIGCLCLTRDEFNSFYQQVKKLKINHARTQREKSQMGS